MTTIISAVPYTGNKRKVWPHIKQHLPDGGIFVDLFCGGGTVSLNANALGRFDKVYANDLCHQVVEVLDNLKDHTFIKRVEALSNQYGKGKEDYLKLRELYNEYKLPEYLLNLLYRSNSNMCRFNKNGGFNMTTGLRCSFDSERLVGHNKVSQGIEYSTEDYHDTVNRVLTNHLIEFDKQITFYVDCPYANCTAEYNSRWTEEDDIELLRLVERLIRRQCKVIMSNVFTNRGKENKLLIDWCERNKEVVDVHHLSEINYKQSSFRKTDMPTDEVLIVSK